MAAGGDARERFERGADSPGAVMGAPSEGPAPGWESYAADEAERVLARFDIGRIRRAEPYRRGSRSAPKLKIKSERGLYLLKRRALRRHPIERIQFAQSFQRSVMARGFPVAPLIPASSGGADAGGTLIVEEGFAYELFDFIEGDRFDKTPRGAVWAGEAMARLHKLGEDVERTGAVVASFHASPAVKSALERLGKSLRQADPSADPREIDELATDLRERYERAVEEIDDLGFRRLPTEVVHGDWHPGNLIFRRGRVAAVIDFDSARIEPRATELANGMLQFALRGEAGVSPLDWPDELDAKRMQGFLHGYLIAAERPLSLDERTMLPWYMVEAMIAESAIPVANQGAFADLPGLPFMRLVLRKCDWVRSHRKAIAAL